MSNNLKLYITDTSGNLSLSGGFIQAQELRLKQYRVEFDTSAHSLAAIGLRFNIDPISGKNFISGYSQSVQDKDDPTSIYLALDNAVVTLVSCDIPVTLSSDLRPSQPFNIEAIGNITGFASLLLVFEFEYEAI